MQTPLLGREGPLEPVQSALNRAASRKILSLFFFSGRDDGGSGGRAVLRYDSSPRLWHKREPLKNELVIFFSFFFNICNQWMSSTNMGQWGQCWGERAEFAPNFPHLIGCPPLFRSCPPNCGAGEGGGGLWVMARALPGPAAIWLVAEGGLANYSHRITLCTTAPACRGREGGRTRGEGAKPQESAWRMDGECSGAKEREEGSQGGRTEKMWLYKG